MQSFKQLKVWEKSHSLVLKIYQITNGFPKEENYGLISQIRRSSSSIPMNIAEGCGKDTDAEFCRFIGIANGSASEVEYQLLLSKDLKYIGLPKFNELNVEITEIKKMLTSLMKRLKSN
ncbi:MAG: four helix bundle protein [Fibrobacteria bacterium]|nr:four helix bundle protein [Fibrobacteria bacterium]